MVTGASSGIGEAFAKRFAKENWNVILTARAIDKLNALSDELIQKHQIKTLVIQMDLSRPSACRQIFDKVKSSKIEIDCLVNNAGFGAVGRFTDRDIYRELEMVDVNVRAVLELTHLFLPGMIEQKHGFVINVSSTASFQPIPYLATYSATKAFVTSLSESLWAECQGTGVKVINLCPGRTKTNFGIVAGQKVTQHDIRPTQTSEAVVEDTFRAMRKNSPTVVTNPFDNLLRFVERFVSRKVVVSVAGKLAKRLGYR